MLKSVQKNKDALKAYKVKLSKIREIGLDSANETLVQKEARIKRAKSDIAFCVSYYFPDLATVESAPFHIYFANRVKKNRKIRAFAEWGRSLGKSLWANCFIPFWLMINDETNFFVLIGANKTNATALLTDLQANLEGNQRIINDFGVQHNPGKWALGDFTTINGFTGKALGVGQKVRGLRVGAHRPDLIVCDDLEDKDTVSSSARQEKIAKWIKSALLKTMDGPTRRFIYALNKFAPVMIQTKLQESNPRWWVHQVCAYDQETYEPAWKAKYDNNYYKELEEEDGVVDTLSEYNHVSIRRGKSFKTEYIHWVKLPRITDFKVIVGRWDVALSESTSADYNAVRVWGLYDNRFWLIDCYVKQSKYKKAIEWIADYQKNTLGKLKTKVQVHWGFEGQFWNDAILDTIEEIEDEWGTDLRLHKVDAPRRNKEVRILATAAYYMNNRIRYNKKLKGHNDTQIGLDQLLGIEPGYSGKDDAPDADEMCFTFLAKYRKNKKRSKPLTGKISRPPKY